MLISQEFAGNKWDNEFDNTLCERSSKRMWEILFTTKICLSYWFRLSWSVARMPGTVCSAPIRFIFQYSQLAFSFLIHLLGMSLTKQAGVDMHVSLWAGFPDKTGHYCCSPLCKCQWVSASGRIQLKTVSCASESTRTRARSPVFWVCITNSARKPWTSHFIFLFLTKK